MSQIIDAAYDHRPTLVGHTILRQLSTAAQRVLAEPGVWAVVAEVARALQQSWSGDAVFPILAKLDVPTPRPISEAAFAHLNHAAPLV